MTFNDFRNLLLSKSLSRSQLPANEQLVHRVQEGLDQIWTEATCETLEVETKPETSPYRQIYDPVDGVYIFYRRPVASVTEDIDIDATLIDALAYYVMAGLERQMSATHMSMYNKALFRHEQLLIERSLDDSYQDRAKYIALNGEDINFSDYDWYI